MSDHPFDDLARTLAAGASRRGVLKAIGGAVLGTVVAAPPRVVLAQGNSDCAHFCNDVEPPGPGRGECKSDAAQGQGLCYTCGPAAPAGHPDVCGVGTSSVACCPAGTPNCCGNTTCVRLATDVLNCGACGKQCTTTVANAHATCTGGTCGFACNTGYTLCNGACVNVQTDLHNCGTCGTVCTAPAHASPMCTNGACSFVCNQGYSRCGNACVNEQTDLNNCGTCGHVCSFPNATATCSSGTCVIATCNPGFADCDGNPANGCETNLQTDARNCGACGHACASGQICSNGSCVCTNGGTLCNGRCCPPSCQCLSSLNGTFCYSGRVGGLCRSNVDCTIAGNSCQDINFNGFGTCRPIDCRTNPNICPAGTQCTAAVTCEELCTAS